MYGYVVAFALLAAGFALTAVLEAGKLSRLAQLIDKTIERIRR